ncbi:MAG: polynucleotide adenylyltransferase PcnB, partial [Dechloromonas sp.]|nr:polynucleotide adenylyltransferase PcnB [Dechloromonas sp.]
DIELAEWWTRFQKVDGEERAEMLQPEQAGDKKRRRRKKKPAAEGSSPPPAE